MFASITILWNNFYTDFSRLGADYLPSLPAGSILPEAFQYQWMTVCGLLVAWKHVIFQLCLQAEFLSDGKSLLQVHVSVCLQQNSKQISKENSKQNTQRNFKIKFKAKIKTKFKTVFKTKFKMKFETDFKKDFKIKFKTNSTYN